MTQIQIENKIDELYRNMGNIICEISDLKTELYKRIEFTTPF